jgi:hypothetical protein
LVVHDGDRVSIFSRTGELLGILPQGGIASWLYFLFTRRIELYDSGVVAPLSLSH